MIIYGHNLYGRVYEIVVEGKPVCYVITRFYHIYFFPLIPTESHIVIAGSEEGNSFRGVQTSLSGISILVAWMRAFSLIFLIGAIIAFFAVEPNHPHAAGDRAVAFLGFIVSILAFAASYPLARPSQATVARILTQLGIYDPQLVEQCMAESTRASASPFYNKGEQPAGPHAGMSKSTLAAYMAVCALISGIGWVGYKALTKTALPQTVQSAAPSPSATPAIAGLKSEPPASDDGPKISPGMKNLEQAKAALDKKDYLNAIVHGDLAAAMLASDKADSKVRIEAHKIALQGYTKRQNYKKALEHAKSLQALDPKGPWGATIAELNRHIPQPKVANAPMRLTADQMRRREEARLNRVIPVKVITNYNPYGHIEHMTVREYERRKAANTSTASVATLPASSTPQARPASYDSYRRPSSSSYNRNSYNRNNYNTYNRNNYNNNYNSRPYSSGSSSSYRRYPPRRGNVPDQSGDSAFQVNP